MGREDGRLRPTLIVGCGGTGELVLQATWRAMEARLERAGWAGGLPKAWQFLAVDASAPADGRAAGTGRSHPRIGRFQLVEGSGDFADHRDQVRRRAVAAGIDAAALDGWLPGPEAVRYPVTHSSGQKRAVGRTLGLSRAAELATALEQMRMAAFTAEATRELADLATALGMTHDRGPDVDAYVVSSLDGGLGSGCFLDIARWLQSWLQPLTHVTGILCTSSLHRSHIAAPLASGLEGNTLAALCELMATQDPEAADDDLAARLAGSVPADVGSRPPLHQVFLASSDTSSQVLAAEQVHLAIGNVLAQLVGSSTGAAAMDAMKANRGLAPEILDPQARALGFGRGTLSSFGSARVTLGNEAFRAFCLDRLVADACAALLGTAQGMPGAGPADAPTPAAEVAEPLEPWFLAGTGLLEPDGDELLTSIDDELRAIVRDTAETAAAEISAALPDDRAEPRAWATRVEATAEATCAGLVRSAVADVETLVRGWAGLLPQRLHHGVSASCARYGAPVTEELLARLEGALQEAEADSNRRAARWAEAHDDVRRWPGEVPRHRMTKASAAFVHLATVAGRSIAATVAQEAERLVAAVLAECREAVIPPARQALRDLTSSLRWPREAAPRPPDDPMTIVLGGVAQFQEGYEVLRRWSSGAPDGQPRWAGELEAAAAVLELALATDEPVGWLPACLGGSDRPPPPPSVSMDAIEDAAGRWMSERGPFADHGFLDWEESFAGPPRVASLALQGFRDALGRALDRAEPLVPLDAARHHRVHGASWSSSVDLYVTCPFPRDHPAGSIVEEDCRARHARVAISYSPIGGATSGDLEVLTLVRPVDPSAVPHLFAPIRARLLDPAPGFWALRRAASSAHSLPLTAEARRRLLRGAAVAGLLGLLEWDPGDGSGRVLASDGSVVGVLPSAREGAPHTTGSLMGLPAAWARWAAGESTALDGYVHLIDLGDLDDESSAGARAVAQWLEQWPATDAIARLEATAAFFEARTRGGVPSGPPAFEPPGTDLAEEIAQAHRAVADHLRSIAG